MISAIHIHPKVKKTMEEMESMDNTPKIAAQRAQNIIAAMANGTSLTNAGKLHKKKDSRIKNVFKFNLGKGYRLLTIKEEDIVFVLFVGDHDQCERWLYSNRKKRPHKTDVPFIIHNTATRLPNKGVEPTTHDMDQEREEQFPPIKQETLRKLFCGLVTALEIQNNGKEV